MTIKHKEINFACQNPNMSKTPIYKRNIFYEGIRPYIDYCCRSVYNKSVVRGMENIPSDGCIIIAPNHTNGMMDPMVILKTFPDCTIFGARADVFRNKIAARFLHWAKIIPMIRERDGIRNVTGNLQSFNEAADALGHNARFCIFSEGTHRTQHSLMPITKGIFRIAIAASGKYGDSKPVYIVPAGIEYGDYFRYKTTAVLTFGKAINVTEYLKSCGEKNKSGIFKDLQQLLFERISSLITYIPADDDYNAKWTLARIASSGITDPEIQLDINRAVSAGIESLKGTETYKELLAEAESFEKERKASKISYYSFGYDDNGHRIAIKTTNAVFGLVFFLYSAAATLPMWLTAETICLIHEDKAFCNSIRFYVKAFMSPIMIALWVIFFFKLLPWPLALILVLFSITSYSKFYEYTKHIRILLSDYRLRKNRSLQEKCEKLRKKIRLVMTQDSIR